MKDVRRRLQPKKTLNLNVNVFSPKVLIRDTIFTSATGDGTAILRGESEPHEGLAAFSSRGVPSFLSYFKTQSINWSGPEDRTVDLPLCS